MSDPQLLRPPERLPVMRIGQGVVFPHVPERRIFSMSPPALVQAMEEAGFCVIGISLENVGTAKTGTLCAIKEIWQDGEGTSSMYITPLRRVIIESVALERVGEDRFYTRRWDSVKEVLVPQAVWLSEKMTAQRRELERLFEQFVRTMDKRIQQHIRNAEENSLLPEIEKLAREAHDSLSILRTMDRQTLGQTVDRISDVAGALYTLIQGPDMNVVFHLLYLLTLPEHHERFEQLIALLSWVSAKQIREHLGGEIEAMATPDLTFPLQKIITSN